MMRIFLLCLFFGSICHAEDSIELKEPVEPAQANYFSAKVDIFPLLVKGVGVGVGISWAQKFNTELFYSRQVISSKDEDSFSFTSGYHAQHTADMFRIRTDYFPVNVFTEGGWYIGAALAFVNLKTVVDPIFSAPRRTLETNRFGYQVFTGYEFKRGFLKKLSSAIRVGLGYGVGGAVSNNLGGTKNEILDNVLLDATYSYIF